MLGHFAEQLLDFQGNLFCDAFKGTSEKLPFGDDRAWAAGLGTHVEKLQCLLGLAMNTVRVVRCSCSVFGVRTI